MTDYRKTSGMATASLVLGIIGLLLPLAGVLAIIFGGIEWSRRSEEEANEEAEEAIIHIPVANWRRGRVGCILGIVSVAWVLIFFL